MISVEYLKVTCDRFLENDVRNHFFQYMSDEQIEIYIAQYKELYIVGNLPDDVLTLFQSTPYSRSILCQWKHEKRFKSQSVAKQATEMRVIRNKIWNMLQCGMNVKRKGKDALRIRPTQ